MSKKTKTKTKTTPWDPAAIKRGEGALDTGYGQAQSTIAQYSPALNAAVNQITQKIAAPPSYVTDARAQLDKTINGDYLDPATNPYSSGMAKLIADRTQGNYNATFGASGRAHGGLAALLSTQGVGDSLNKFYGDIYNNERQRQYGATMAEPAFHQDEYTDINELFPAVQNTAMLPLQAAGQYAGGLGGLLSPYNTSTTTQKQSMLPQLLGLAAQIGSAFMPMPGGGMASMGATKAADGGLGFLSGFGG
jgi:hypothetical protein